MNPKLNAYKIDPEAWAKKMISRGTRDKQWDLVVEEVGPEIYRFPLFTKEFCDLVIEHAEKNGKWTKERHKFYPTTDILLYDLNLKEMYNYVLKTYCHPISRHLWGLEGTTWIRATSENFIDNNINDYVPGYDWRKNNKVPKDLYDAWKKRFNTVSAEFEGDASFYRSLYRRKIYKDNSVDFIEFSGAGLYSLKNRGAKIGG